MMERVRILLVAAPTAPVRGLAIRLHDPDIDVLTAASAREALERVGAGMPEVVIIDGSLPGREVFRLYGRLRATAPGSAVPIVFTSHDRSDADAAPTTAPDYYLGPEASLDHIEQVVFSFLPASLMDEEADEELPFPEESPPADQFNDPVQDYGPRGQLTGGGGAGAVARPAVAAAQPDRPAAWSELLAQMQTGSAAIGLAYLGIYLTAEVLAAGIDSRLGLVVHAGLLLAIFFHGANVPPGPERAFFWTLWLAPLTRIYGLAQPFGGVQPLYWWALTTIPMAVAGFLAMRLVGQSARDSNLIPSPREIPIAIFMVPVGLAAGVIMYMLLDPRALGRELAFGGFGTVALIVLLNPGLVDELVFRGVLQRAITGLLGSRLGVLYTALLYAPVVPAGLISGVSLLAVILTFSVGLGLSFLTLKTGSVLSAVAGHMSLALGLFVIGPYLAPGTVLPAPAATPAVPIAKPALVVSPTPAAPAPQVTLPTPLPKPAAPAGQPSPAAQTGPAQPGPTPTPFTLAPPLPTPTSAPPTAAPAGPPPGGTANIPGQIVVVRGTGGSGARLRAQPGNSGSIITVIPEYTPLVVIGQDRIVDGIAWRNVRAPNGSEGWIAASFVTTG
jgi:uncharacterized protein